MIHQYNLLLFFTAYFFTIASHHILADEVPVFVWNTEKNSSVKSVSAFGKHDKIFDDFLGNAEKILVLSLSKLSLEDFDADEKSNALQSIEKTFREIPYVLLPSVKDPLSHVHNAHCRVQEIVMERNMDEHSLQLISTALDNSCAVIAHISDDMKFDPNGLQFPGQHILGVLTARKSSLGSDYHMSRNLLATADPDPNFVNYTGCIIMYAENATLKIGRENNSVSLSFPVTTDGSECTSNVTTLQINFPPSGSVSAVALRFNFRKSEGFWKTETSVSITGGKAPEGEIELDSQYLEASVGFSYSCGQLILEAKNAKNLTEPVTITIDRFQIQPFGVNEKFSESFDCVPFFTVPIWMGIFVSLLLVGILNFGIYAVFSVNTMDRFDDPKGKTISVGTSGD